jgi:transposase
VNAAGARAPAGSDSYLWDVGETVHIEAYKALQSENRELRNQVAQLAHELSQLKRLIFGTKSERFIPEGGPDQLPLFEGATPQQQPAPSQTQVVERRPRKKPVRQPLPSHLPREVIVIEPEEDTTGLRKIGEEVTETLDYHPAKLKVIRRVRPKYVDPKDEDRGVVIGELPPRPVDKGMAEPALLAHVAIEKYMDHLPLYRQVQRFTREGITLAASTLGDWITATADLLVPLYEELTAEALGSGYIQADETPIQVQDNQKAGATHRGYYWVYHAPTEGLVVMDYQKGRSRDGPAAFLSGYAGALQSDGYAAYDAFESLPEITAYGCWAHVRRYFHEALDSAPEEAEHVLGEVAELYAIERVLRERNASADDRQSMRKEEATPVLDRIKTYLEANPGLPKSPWGQAVGYALGRWKKLCRYVDDGRIEVDNNLIENAIRPIALGRRNYLFAGSHAAARRSAVIYSLLATCKKHEINPQQWLTDVLSRIPTHPAKDVAELLPHRWKPYGK